MSRRIPVLLHLLLAVTAASPLLAADRPNVLFIAVDDLNHWVGHLGRNRQALTPNIDRLAARGVTFTRAYCAAPVCNPSRAALMSGLRPGTTGVYHNETDWRPRIAEPLMLTSHFRAHGFRLLGAGKIYHGGFDRPSEWDEYHAGRSAGEGRAGAVKSGGFGSLRWAQLDAGDEVLADHDIVSWCKEQLEKKHDKPFFLACGLHKPHLPWRVPRRHFDLHPLEAIELPPFRSDDLDDVPPAGRRMAHPAGDHAAITRDGSWKEAIQAYLAAVSYADAEIGRLLAALERSPHAGNTVVVLFGDHGWHLGEKHHWRKFALWEEATRAPLIWVVPGLTKPGGICERTVDFQSIYPTLAEVAGLPIPGHVEGSSFRSLLADPGTAWDRPALTTNGCRNHAVRTEGWRYIRYANGDEELYDEAQDPYEWTNLANRPERAAIKAQLARSLPGRNEPEPVPEAKEKKQRKAKSGVGE